MATKNIYFDDTKLEIFEKYCEKTGRKLSPLISRALEEYMQRNPVK